MPAATGTTSAPAQTIRFAFSDEQEAFRVAIRRFLTDKSPTTEVRRLMATDEGYDAGVWRRLSDELALPGIHVPERYGGSGFGPVELGIALEEQGRALLCAPYFASAVLAAGAVLNAGTEEQKERLLPGLAAGRRLGALAVTEPNGEWDPRHIELTATPRGDRFVLTGSKSFVVDGHVADLLVVAARTTDGTVGLFTLDAATAGVTRRLLHTLDPTRKLAHIEFRDADAEPLGSLDHGLDALTRTLDQAAVALASEMVGGAQTMLDSAVEYAKLRVQFGRTIGSFQAIKHKCADMLLDVELAKSAAYYAAEAQAADDPEWPALACLAKASASEAYLRTAAECIQIHGGIGFTWENDTHLWFKRAKSSQMLLGSPAYHRELLLQRWEV